MRLERIFVLRHCLIMLPWGARGHSTEGGEVIETPEMDAYWATHAAQRQSGDLEAALSILAEDCVLYEPFSPPVSGRETIAATMDQARQLVETHEVFLDSQEVYHHGGWLVGFRTFSETVSFKGEEDRHVLEGSYSAVLERYTDGGWKVKRFMALPSTPPPAE